MKVISLSLTNPSYNFIFKLRKQDNLRTTEKGKNMIKKILAIIGIALIFLWIAATFVIAVFPIPLKETIFPIMAVGCVFLPIVLWIFLWMISFITGKKNIASPDNGVKKPDLIVSEETKSEENEETNENN